MVTKEESDARDRLASLEASKGRIRIHTGNPPVAVQVDAGEPRLAGFIAWVTPGQHAVTFSPGTPEAEAKTIEVGAGAVVEVSPSAPQGAAPAQPPVGPLTLSTAPGPTSPTAPARERPFSPLVLGVTGAATLVAGAAAVSLEVYAESLRSRDTAEQSRSPDHVISAGDRQSFDTARTAAYATVAAASALAVATAAVTTWYLVGPSPREPRIVPAAVPERGGARVVVETRF